MYRSRQILAELEIKHEFMLEQESKRLSPEEERAQLLASVKNDNAEVNAMEQQIKEISGSIEQINNELKEVDDVIDFLFNCFARISLKRLSISSLLRIVRLNVGKSTAIYANVNK